MKLKIEDSTSFKIKELLQAIENTCSIDEKIQAKKIFKIYLDRTEID
tara:strand:+ start:2869 stop:3009 length:141 start_codon:yes stop_codon:yes gene_type:complete